MAGAPELKLGRTIAGMSAVLVPLDRDREIDWDAFAAHIARTHSVGITPAVNMDTGYVNLISHNDRLRVLDETRAILSGEMFVAGAFWFAGHGRR